MSRLIQTLRIQRCQFHALTPTHSSAPTPAVEPVSVSATPPKKKKKKHPKITHFTFPHPDIDKAPPQKPHVPTNPDLAHPTVPISSSQSHALVCPDARSRASLRLCDAGKQKNKNPKIAHFTFPHRNLSHIHPNNHTSRLIQTRSFQRCQFHALTPTHSSAPTPAVEPVSVSATRAGKKKIPKSHISPPHTRISTKNNATTTCPD
jgi:hypothetical protein